MLRLKPEVTHRRSQRPAFIVPPGGQRSVDHFAATVDGADCPVAPGSAGRPHIPSRADVAAELRSVQLGLVQFGDKLSIDCRFVATHPGVQFLDSAVQRIAKVLKAFEAESVQTPQVLL